MTDGMSDSGSTPIFVRGMSRSGGTLAVTLLDAHSKIAMSYELYENLLAPDESADLNVTALVKYFSGSRFKRKKKLIAGHPHRGIRTYIARMIRGGLDLADFVNLLTEFGAAGYSFENQADRFKFIEMCGSLKMKREGKSYWGMKCNSNFEDYHAHWPAAYFINVVRDGRDVLASQLNTGAFSKPAGELGKSWQRNHLRFRSFMAKEAFRGFELYYEKLAMNPGEVAAELCSFLNLDYQADMLSFHNKDLTIFKANHLSMKRISEPIDTAKIGRWRRDLSQDQLRDFCSNAEEALSLFGYTEEVSC